MSYEKPKYCGNCGKQYIDGATFCAYCGTPIPVINANVTANTKSIFSTTSIQSSYDKRSISSYHSSSEQDRMLSDPSLPFTQHFKGVLLSPQAEMPQIVNRKPNLIHPLFIVLICGIFSAISSFILLSKTTIQLSNTFSDPLLSTAGISAEEYIQILSSYVIPFSTAITFLIFWVISGLVLWIAQSLISSNIPAHRRNFKVQLTISGWSYLPLIFYELIKVIVITLLVEPSTFVVNELYDIALIGSLPDTIGLFMTIISIFFLIWRVLIVYFAVRTLDPEGSHATIITVVYAILVFFST